MCWRRSDPEALIQCRNGHFGCTPCFKRLKTCPLCRVILEPEILSLDKETIKIIHKKLRDVESNRAVISLEAIVKMFRCSQCRVASTMAPVFQCQNGHVHCYRCPGRGKCCSPCFRINGQYSNLSFTIRSLAVQELLCSVPKQCRFIKNACSAIVEGFTQHEVNCLFSENYCVLSYCPEIVPLSKLLTHILKDCSLTSEVVDSTDLRKFKDTRCDEITVPCVHEGKLNYNRDCANILKVDADKYFLFCCIPQWTLSRSSYTTSTEMTVHRIAFYELSSNEFLGGTISSNWLG